MSLNRTAWLSIGGAISRRGDGDDEAPGYEAGELPPSPALRVQHDDDYFFL